MLRSARRYELQRAQVVPGDRTDVGDAEVLEELPGLGEVDDRLAQPARQLEQRRADERQLLDRRRRRRASSRATCARA